MAGREKQEICKSMKALARDGGRQPRTNNKIVQIVRHEEGKVQFYLELAKGGEARKTNNSLEKRMENMRYINIMREEREWG